MKEPTKEETDKQRWEGSWQGGKTRREDFTLKGIEGTG